ncbi:MAG: helix-turn-helix domain-containing protein [Candidatus Spechtbacterales bacterium]|nr:helix-turn-helix domain-containing protein [Candidatus Spechtbacterales bacterium]
MAINARKLANKRFYTVGEAAYILGVTPLTMRNWDKKGKLKAKRNPINNYRIYKASDIENFLRKLDGPKNTLDIV